MDADGKLSGPRTVLAGFGAGVTESLLAVTPTESIKTTLYAPPLACLSSRKENRIASNLGHPLAESTTESPPSPGYAASSTPSPSSPVSAASGASSRDSCPRLRGRPPTARLASPCTMASSSWPRGTQRQGRSWERLVPLRWAALLG